MSTRQNERKREVTNGRRYALKYPAMRDLLIIHPLAVLLMLALVPPFDPKLTQAALVLAGLPMVTIFPLLAQRYGQGEQCASALLVATLLSFLTLNLGLWALGVGVRCGCKRTGRDRAPRQGAAQ